MMKSKKILKCNVTVPGNFDYNKGVVYNKKNIYKEYDVYDDFI